MNTKPTSKHKSQYFLVFNAIWFQLFWILAVVYQFQYIVLIGALLVLHFCITKSKLVDSLVFLVGSLIGYLIDSLLTLSGLFIFEEQFTLGRLPVWLVLLWGAFFLSTFYGLSAWIKSGILQAGMGAIAGPMSYIAGHHFDAVSFSQSTFVTFLILAPVWAILLPSLIALANSLRRVSSNLG